jgi:hypothetical protein
MRQQLHQNSPAAGRHADRPPGAPTLRKRPNPTSCAGLNQLDCSTMVLSPGWLSKSPVSRVIGHVAASCGYLEAFTSRPHLSASTPQFGHVQPPHMDCGSERGLRT